VLLEGGLNMLLMRLRNIKKAYQDTILLKDINLDIKINSVIGLVGLNGAGKTTLAKIINGLENYDSGMIDTFNKEISISFLKQSTEFDETIFNQMLVDDNMNVLETSSFLGLKQLQNWSNEKMNHLSGGEKTKLSLAKIFNENSDLLILDEPTNHLDYIGIDWLIDKIKKYTNALLIISHDRYFLDQVTTEIVELENGVIHMYNGNYTQYRKMKEDYLNNQKHLYEEQQKREKHIVQEINRLKVWSNEAHKDSTKKEGFKEYWRMKAKKKDIQIKSSIKRLEKMKEEGIIKPKEEEIVNFQFVSVDKAGKSFITAENLSKSFPDKTLFKGSQFYVKRGEKVGLIGINGCGKTTLIKMILGEDQNYEGLLNVSKSTKIAYLNQDVMDLDDDKSIKDILRQYDKSYQTKVRTMLALSGITSRMFPQVIRSLSLGERTRIKLVFLILTENNVLILDEPTNHLDLHSREQLEKTLESYKGTLLIASHDRYLLNKVTNKLLLFDAGNVKRIEVGYKEYQEGEKEKFVDKKAYDLMIIQNKITYVLAELSKYKETDDRYRNLEQDFNELIKQKNDLIKH